MNETKRREIFRRLAAANPAPRTELHYATPYQLLVAVMLSAQATDKGVNIATARLFPRAGNAQAMLDLGLESVEELISSLNYYRTKARHVMAASRQLVEQYDGDIPADRRALESLPGVGRKTANVVLNTVFRQPVMAVDTHIFRVANRTRLAPGKTVREVEDKLVKFVPREYLVDAHHWLILHGRYTCKARRPACENCLINDLCEFRGKPTASLPAHYNAAPSDTDNPDTDATARQAKKSTRSRKGQNV